MKRNERRRADAPHRRNARAEESRPRVSDSPAWVVMIPLARGDRLRVMIAIVTVWAALFAPQLFGRQVFTGQDARVFRPFSEFSRERWTTKHERTQWNPYVYAGLPAGASLADSRPQYLPDAALDLFERFRPSRAIPLGGPLLAHLAGMIAMALLARELWGTSKVGMAYAGIVWGLMPELVAPLASGHDAQFVSASLIPVVLLAIHFVFASRPARAAAAALLFATVAALFILTGHPQLVVYGALFGTAFAIERALYFRRPARGLWLSGAALLAVALSAAVWLPALYYSAASFRGGAGMPGISDAEVARFSFAWRDLLTLAWPWAVGFGESTYWGGLAGTNHPSFVGASVLMLATSAAIRRGNRGTRIMLLTFIAFAVLASLGTTLGPLGHALRGLVPLGERFRTQMMWMVVAQIGIVLIAARSFAPPPDRPGLPRWAWVVGLIGLAIGLLLVGPLSDDYAAAMRAARPADADVAVRVARTAGVDLMIRSLVAAAAVALLWITRSRSRHAPRAQIGLLVMAMLGHASVSWPILQRQSGPLERIAAAPEPELARLGAREPAMRVSSTRRVPSAPGQPIQSARDVEFYSNDWIRWRAHALGGNHGALPALWRPMGPVTRSFGALRALGVGYMSADSAAHWSADRFEEVHRDPGEVVYRLRGALGRAYAVPRIEHRLNDRDVLHAMMAEDFDPARVAYTTDDGIAGDYPGSAACRIAWIADDPDRVAFDCVAPDRAFLIVADTWFDGWKARLDGSVVAIARVDQLGRGIALPPGHHRVEMRFVPAGWREGVGISRIAFLLWLAAALFVAYLSRQRPSTPETTAQAPMAAAS